MRSRRGEWAWFAVALLAAFAVAFAISLAASRGDRAAHAPSSAALDGGSPAAALSPPARLREVAPVPRLAIPSPAPAPVRPAITAAPTPIATATATPTPTPTPTPVAAPQAPPATPAPTRAPPPRKRETIGQEFDSSG